MNEIKFVYQRDEKDILTHTIWHRMRKSKFNIFANIMFPVVGIYALIYSIGNVETPLQYVAVVYLIMYPFITYFLIKFRIRSMFKNGQFQFDLTTYTVNETGILSENDKGSFLVEWNKLVQIYNTKDYIYLYLDKRSTLVVSKEVLGEAKTQGMFEMILRYADPIAIKFKRKNA